MAKEAPGLYPWIYTDFSEENTQRKRIKCLLFLVLFENEETCKSLLNGMLYASLPLLCIMEKLISNGICKMKSKETHRVGDGEA